MKQDSPPRFFLISARADRQKAQHVFKVLTDAGLPTLWPEERLLGSRLDSQEWRRLREQDTAIALVTREAVDDPQFSRKLKLARSRSMAIVPVFLKKTIISTSEVLDLLNEYQGIYIESWPDDLKGLVDGLKRREEEARWAREAAFSLSAPLAAQKRNLYLRKVVLENVRCFGHLTLDLDVGSEPAELTMILGDNASGKSTLLRSIALGLCSQTGSSALLKELPGSFLRKGASEGSIRLELTDGEDGSSGTSGRLAITTRLKKGTADELIEQETEPADFPWNDLFACAYGTNRSRQATASYESYTTHQAVRPLFDDGASLQNPELVLLRQPPIVRGELEARLLEVLMLDGEEHTVRYPTSGSPEIHGPWGDQPLLALSDGYRSTAQWLLDFLSWAIYAGRLGSNGDVGGILLLDELEQHLHPRWQRHIVQRLRRQFPKTQIFASTHTPLVAAGTADVDAGLLLRLKTNPDGGLETQVLDPKSLAGLRADQVLASDAFGLVTSRNPGSEDDLARYAELLGKEKRTAAEEREMSALAARLERSLSLGENEAAREVEKAVEAVLEEKVQSIQPELLDLETKRQLREIFGGGGKG